MVAPIRMEASIAVTMRRFRPKRMAASLPATLANVPMRPSPVATMAGERNEAAARAGGHRHVAEERHTPAAQCAHLQRMDAVGDGVGHGRAVAEHRPEIVEALPILGRSGAFALTRARSAATKTHATAALAAAARKAACQPAAAAMRSPVANERAPEMPMLAA